MSKDRSKNTLRKNLLSKAQRTSLVKHCNANVFDFWALKPNWKCNNVTVITNFNHSVIQNCFTPFTKAMKIFTGRKYVALLNDLLLCKWTTLAIFKHEGNLPICRERFHRYVRTWVMCGRHFFINDIGMSSCPAELSLFYYGP